MEDSEIITLYWNRDERAIAETGTKYGSFCQRIAQNILTVREDAEEWRRDHAQKRYAGLEALFSELEECIPSGETAERQLEEGELTQVLNDWLASLSQSDRVLFLRRYWNGEPLKELEQAYGLTHSTLAKRMYRLRGSLRKTLEREGYTL